MMPSAMKNGAVVEGAAPPGAQDRESRARAVREMFTAIAPRYDLLNHVLSFSVDRLWWNRAAGAFPDVLSRPDAKVLDLCCGTGDMTNALRRKAAPGIQIAGVDFSHAMLVRAQAKITRLQWIEADALQLPFADSHFDLVTSAFGFRNLVDYDAGLHEIWRVLRPGGKLGILDCSEPRGVIGTLYRIYFKRVLPRIGFMISGVQGAYQYLPDSVGRFPKPEQMLPRMHAAGFANAAWRPFSLGIAGLYTAQK
jgi:demethylmenaquinone methyltransferase/2-methoxy-6-polyprenyl-1,4-benzoquinol methylase